MFGFPAHAANGSCFLCGLSPDGPVVVTEKYDEWAQGSVCIGVNCGCAKYIGKLVGLVEGKRLVTENTKLRGQVAELTPLAERYQEVRRALDGLSLAS